MKDEEKTAFFDGLWELVNGLLASDKGKEVAREIIVSKISDLQRTIEAGSRLLDIIDAVGDPLPEALQYDVKKYLGMIK